MKTRAFLIFASLSAFALSACSPSASQLKKTLEENPDIVFNAIEKNPNEFFETVKKAQQAAQSRGQEDYIKSELERAKKDLASPVKVDVDDKRVHGNTKAPVTIVEYSDYNCGHCGRAHETMAGLKEKYGDKVRFVFKQLPILSPTSETAAQYVEAAMLQSKEIGYKIHSEIFSNQGDFRKGGEDFLKEVAKKAGADMSKLRKDLKSSLVKKRIEADKKEAKDNDFNGTPGFFVNGVAVRGAYPPEFFEQFIDHILSEEG